ncbi:hypothetical protein [Actinopolymorpha pittospori]|uniref:Secreted protein n=1 Tax=Actinopolymorpha pittospori TaxID=648752 RepID=A0A927RAH7_9ACTN|nr:hypothetical protein [Actinopolymorpha pittospori]MBE1609002.1 hypothetical protein [Actinopolymorpha pittospori]
MIAARIRESVGAGKTRLVVAVAAAAFVAAASPASASTDDGFAAVTTPASADGVNCGAAFFIDYGPGAEGGGDNDDYVYIVDACGDSHGVKAWAWNGSKLLGSKYLGTGASTHTVWDPFPNVVPGELVGLKVCLVDGSNDQTPFQCGTASHRSVDG